MYIFSNLAISLWLGGIERYRIIYIPLPAPTRPQPDAPSNRKFVEKFENLSYFSSPPACSRLGKRWKKIGQMRKRIRLWVID